MYFLTVARLIPNSRAIPRIDMPLRFAFCIAFHRAFWRNVAFRGGMAAILPAAVSWLATGSGAVSSAQLVSSWRRVVAQVLAGWSGSERWLAKCGNDPLPVRMNAGLGGAS